jgi:hypothetical protein
MVDMNQNISNMEAPWDPTQPFKTVLQQLKDGQTFAADNNEPITNTELIRKGYNIVKETGLFDIACCKWQLKNITTTQT